jgi:hypothetical protein
MHDARRLAKVISLLYYFRNTSRFNLGIPVGTGPFNPPCNYSSQAPTSTPIPYASRSLVYGIDRVSMKMATLFKTPLYIMHTIGTRKLYLESVFLRLILSQKPQLLSNEHSLVRSPRSFPRSKKLSMGIRRKRCHRAIKLCKCSIPRCPVQHPVLCPSNRVSYPPRGMIMKNAQVPPMQVPQEIRADISWMQSNEHNLVATPARAPRRRYLATSCSISSNSSSSTHKASGDRYGDDARVLVGDDASVYAKRAGNSFVNS